MENIRTVIWDCDGVMWFHRPEETQILADALGIKEVEELSAQFFDMIDAFNKEFATKIVTIKEMYEIIEKEMPILFFYNITPGYFMDIWAKLKFEINVFNPDVVVVMKYLNDKCIRCIIKTDWWCDVQIDMLKEFGILEFIEMIHSCNNSYLKCNPLSAEGIIVPGREDDYVIIGDSPNSDLCFANHTGIKLIWFNHDGKKKNNTEYKPTYEVTSLLEVMKII